MYDQATRSFEFSIHARELSIVEAGLGCAVWDASIILARYSDNMLLFS